MTSELSVDVTKLNPNSTEAANCIYDVIESIDGCYKQSNPFMMGMGESINGYQVQVFPTPGVVSVQKQVRGSLVRYTHIYQSVMGAIGWILCHVDYGNNPGQYEAVSTIMEVEGPGGSTDTVIISSENKISQEKMDYFKKVFQEISGGRRPGMSSEDGLGTPTQLDQDSDLQDILDLIRGKGDGNEDS